MIPTIGIMIGAYIFTLLVSVVGMLMFSGSSLTVGLR